MLIAKVNYISHFNKNLTKLTDFQYYFFRAKTQTRKVFLSFRDFTTPSPTGEGRR